ncbi:MAG: UDP-N-acetylmuramoyl-L-alanyl-D-glutamate--2,6-diaminopimelate ligase, partial [Anaerolineales bacterium]|nr:UDP-N-acetylmuramoyl-L-alanyl-D-glutamate--2,6-diaminopimelate ligase [Anaerolineales bacterium]
MFTLTQLLQLLPSARYEGSPPGENLSIQHVAADSRTVRAGSLFVAVPGGSVDGHRFIPAAFAAGAVAAAGTKPAKQLRDAKLLNEHQPYIRVVDSRSSLAIAAAALHDFPSRKLAVIGVTGTDGKTTTATLLESILAAASSDATAPQGRVGIVTTVGARIMGQESDTGLHVTTPDAPEVQEFLAQMVDGGCRYAVIESTSHGLAQARVAAVDFDVAAVTNITHEHLDYHGTRDAYVAAKALLFRALYASPEKPGMRRCAVLNADDAGSYGALLSVLNEEAHEHDRHVQVRSYGLPGHSQARLDVAAVGVDYGIDRTQFELRWWGGAFPVETRLIGEFNVYNVLCAATAALSLNASPAAVQAGVEAVTGVIGRMERIDGGQPFLAVVDFAHTPNSLERALQTLRPLVTPHADGTPGRLIAVFGSAGLRDRAKRALMGRASGAFADFTVITAEDPRTEDLAAICAEIATGVRETADDSRFVIVPDRAAAIQYAVDMAQPGDVVGAFGKGHERSMCF